MITKEQAMAASYRQTLYHLPTGKKVRVNGKCKVWVRSPERFQLPVKYGLKECLYITEVNAADFSLECAK